MDYFIRPDGDDSANGTSPLTSWKTLERANRASYRPGDRLRLRGGATYRGGLKFTPENVTTDGDGRQFITIESYDGEAIIQATESDGILVRDLGGFVIRHLTLTGSGRDKSKYCGVQFLNNLRGATKLSFVRIEYVKASRFGGAGIQFGASPNDNSKSGYRDVRVTKCIVQENIYHGIHFWGAWDQSATTYAHSDIMISQCLARDNPGDPEYRESHSGNGIIVSDTDGGRIEYCTAYGNGASCNNPGGGPVGIWAHASNRILIQYCASFNNRTGNSTDGGGFDFDGGVSNSILQYNYSGGNDGSGYLLYAYSGSPYTFRGNIVRYNISDRDGAKNHFGMIHLDTAGPQVHDIDIYHNTIIAAPKRLGDTRGILVRNATDVRIRNNVIVTEGDIPLIDLGENCVAVRAVGNAYWSGSTPFLIRDNGKDYRSLDQWRRATGQEHNGGQATGLSNDPRLKGYQLPSGFLDTLRNSPNPVEQVLRKARLFRPRPDSPLVRAAQDWEP
jgi:hypothetical protein